MNIDQCLNRLSVEQVEQAEARFTNMFRMCTDNPHGAAHGVSNVLKEIRLSISDLAVVITGGDVESTLRTLLQENRELRADVSRLKGSQGLTWEAFVEACGRKFDTDAKGWHQSLAAALGIQMRDITTFKQNNRVPVLLLRRLDELPEIDDRVEKAKDRRRTNFIRVGGGLVDALRMGGMAPTEIALSLTQFLRDYDGDEVGLNQVLGRRTVVSQDDIRPANDGSKIDIAELTAMGNQLWDKDAYKRPMETFVQTHTQIDISGYNHRADLLNKLSKKARGGLRQAYHAEMAMRAKHPKYERFSRAFALMPKRTKTRQIVLPVNGINGGYISKCINLWFGNFAIQCLETFSGWDERYLSDIMNDRRAPPEELTTLILNMEQCLTNIDVDDKDFVDKVFRIVKTFRGQD